MPSLLHFEPRKNQGRTLCLCFDGTSESYGAVNSNIVKIFSLLKKDDPARQLVYYQSGIGTYVGPALITILARKVAMAVDTAIAYSIDKHVMAGYRFLMDNWVQGDRICMFGFSRGAYTARALAGMLYGVGLLPKGMHEEVSFAYNIYRHEKTSAAYKRDFGRTVSIEFIGVFDTVSAVGALFPRTLPFSADNHITRTFRHALSLDEHRAAFMPQPWVRTVDPLSSDAADPNDQSDKGSIGKKHVGTIRTGLSQAGRFISKNVRRVLSKEVKGRSNESKPPPQEGPRTDVKEVYFAGCHGDVGGGAVPNGIEHALAYIPLRWMVKEILIASHAGILWNEDDPRFAQLGIILHPKDDAFKTESTSPISASEPGPSNGNGSQTIDIESSPPSHDITTPVDYVGSDDAEIDRCEPDDAPSPHLPVDAREEDVLAPIHDPLETVPAWWIIEFLPFVSAKQVPNDIWTNRARINFFRGRTIPLPPSPTLSPNSRESADKRGAKISTAPALWHVSVLQRMRASPEELRTAAVASGKKESAFWRWYAGEIKSEDNRKPYLPRAKLEGGGEPVFVR